MAQFIIIKNSTPSLITKSFSSANELICFLKEDNKISAKQLECVRSLYSGGKLYFLPLPVRDLSGNNWEIRYIEDSYSLEEQFFK